MRLRLRSRQPDLGEQVGQTRTTPKLERQRRLLASRHRAGIRLLDEAPSQPRFVEPEAHRLPSQEPLPDLDPETMSAGVIRAAILRDGAALVRGLIPPERAIALAQMVDRAYRERQRSQDGAAAAAGYYEEFVHEPQFAPVSRAWVQTGGGLLMVDSPILSFAVSEAFSAAGVPGLVSNYLGEPALLSEQKTTLRKADPSVAGAWHQDGKFMGPVRALNLWVSLSSCGADAPGLDLVPRRLDAYLSTGAELAWTVSENEVRKAAGQAGIVKPIFEPGDAMFFDELFLHKTGSDPAMSKPRFAIESWFFGASKFPGDYAPLAI
jgi:hypothetical protein